MPTPPEYWFLLPVCDDLRETQIQSVMTTFALEPDLAISEMLVVDGLLPPDWDSQFEVLHDEASAVIARNQASAKAARQLVSNAGWEVPILFGNMQYMKWGDTMLRPIRSNPAWWPLEGPKIFERAIENWPAVDGRVIRHLHRLARIGRDRVEGYELYWQLAQLGYALVTSNKDVRLLGFSTLRIPSGFLV